MGIRFTKADERVGELNLTPVRYTICPELLEINEQICQLTQIYFSKMGNKIPKEIKK